MRKPTNLSRFRPRSLQDWLNLSMVCYALAAIFFAAAVVLAAAPSGCLL